MKKVLLMICVLFVGLVFVTGVIAQEKPKASQPAAAAEKAPAKKPAKAKPIVTSFLGDVMDVNADAKTIVVKAKIEMEQIVMGKNDVLKEYVVNEIDIKFDVSKAKYIDYKNLDEVKKGDMVRVTYTKKGDSYIAKTVDKITKR